MEKFSEQPYTFYHLGQKFVLKWVIVDPDTGLPEIFTLEANGAALSQLEYLAPDFKMVDEDPAFFDAWFSLNNHDHAEAVHIGSFEWRAATLGHKIAEKI